MMMNTIMMMTRSNCVDWLLLEMRQQGIYSFLAEILSYALVSVSGSAGDTVQPRDLDTGLTNDCNIEIMSISQYTLFLWDQEI